MIRFFREKKHTIHQLIEGFYPYVNRLKYGPLMQHKSGWTNEVLSAEMKKVGFKIVHTGVGMLHGMGYRDFRVEGIKP